MRKIYLMLLCVAWACVLNAQTYPASLDKGNAIEPEPSSIDLLKRSLNTSKDTSANGASSSNVPAVQPTSTTPSSKGTYLEMPLSSGQVVKTKVTKPKATKQASAGPNVVNPQIPQPTSQKTVLEAEIEQNNALAEGERSGKPTTPPTSTSQPAESAVPTPAADEAEVAAQAELDYAARMLRQAKQNTSGERFIPQAASKVAQEEPVAAPTPTTPNRPFNPNEFRPGVEWTRNNSTHFVIYTQKRDGGIGSSNMGMIFETAYATLRRNIPWMMTDKVRIFVYQDHNSYLKYEPNAKAWTRALAYPTRGEIVVYDEPGKQQELKEVFTHELVHIFTQKFFDKYKTGRLITPAWLDEGLAVYMEDQAYNGIKGGPWTNDLKTLNFQRSKQNQVATFGSTSMFGSSQSTTGTFGKKKQGPVLYFMPFDQFMSDGSLSYMESRNKTQDWYFQAYAMVRFLLNPAGGSSPSNRMQFEQFTRLIAQGEQVRDPSTGFPMRGRDGKPIYQPYSVEKAMGRAYRYSNAANFEDNFWRWASNQ